MTEETTPGPDFVRFIGGPLDGQQWGTSQWPPPERLTLADMPPGVVEAANSGGAYFRSTYSALPEPVPHVMRGAQYEWREST